MAAILRLLFSTALLLTVSLSATAQVDSLSALATHVSEQARQRVDSLRQRLQTAPDRAQAYHDSVLYRLQARRDSVRQQLTLPLDSLRAQVRAQSPRVGSQSGELPSLPSLPAVPSTPPLPSPDELSTKLTQHVATPRALDQARSVVGSAEQHLRQTTTSAQTGAAALPDAPASLEAYLAQQEALQPLARQQLALEGWTGNPMGESGPPLSSLNGTSPEALAEPMKQVAVRQATRHFAQHSEALQQGQQQLSKLKKKYKAVQSEQDKYERATSLRGEPWTARLLLGSYFQVYREPNFQIDLSPFVGYRFNTRWSAGVGGSYRAAFRRAAFRRAPGSSRLYQGRVFVEGQVYRGFGMQASYELSGGPTSEPVAGEGGTISERHLLVGVGKSYRITRKLQGTTLLLYRPGSISQSLRLSRWNLRTGFSLGW